VDPAGVALASDRAAALMQSLAAGQVARGMVDVYPAPAPARTVSLDTKRLCRVLGTAVPAARVRAIFESLALPVESTEGDVITVVAPSFRPDLECEADLIEEVSRMYGLEHIPDTVPSATVVPGADDSSTRALFRFREVLAGGGLREMMSYSFTSAALLDDFDATDQARRVVLPNPVSADQGVLRHTLVPQVVECLARNHARQIESAALFEIGTVFSRDDQEGIQEQTAVAFGLTGQLDPDSLHARDTVRDEDVFLALKGIVEQVAIALRAGRVAFRPATAAACDPGTAVEVWLDDDRRLGYIGLLRRDLRRARRLKAPVAIGELSVAPLLANVFQTPVYQAIASYPSISRDMAMVADAAVTHERIMQVIERVRPGELTDVMLFDIFISEELNQGCKSLGYSLTYQSAERTLTDEEANALHERIKEALRQELGVAFREG